MGIKAQESCCEGFDCCCSAECGFHKIWQCELFCLQLECGSPGWAPKCGGNCFKCETGFPKFCALGMCCHHCHLNNWCCEYWAHPFGEHCAANQSVASLSWEWPSFSAFSANASIALSRTPTRKDASSKRLMLLPVWTWNGPGQQQTDTAPLRSRLLTPKYMCLLSSRIDKATLFLL